MLAALVMFVLQSPYGARMADVPKRLIGAATALLVKSRAAGDAMPGAQGAFPCEER